MAVRFVGHRLSYRPGEHVTLFGEPFPSGDIRAYWNMVPDEILVEWSVALGIFFLYRLHGHLQRAQIGAVEATQLSTWMSVISRLCNDEPT